MATVEGLNLRSGRFYLRVLIPQDLQEAYEGRTRVNLSLHTSDRATAVLNDLRVKVKWLESFASKRQEAFLGNATAESLLTQGEGIHLVSDECENKPVEARSESPQALTTLATPRQQNAYQDLTEDLLARNHTSGTPSSLKTRQRPSRMCNAPNKGMSMWEIYEQWKKTERRAKENKQAYAHTLTLAEQCLGAPLHIRSISRAHGNAFKAWLLAPEQGYTPKTCKNHFTNFQSLLRFAYIELEAIQQNPCKVSASRCRRSSRVAHGAMTNCDCSLASLFSKN